MPASKPARIASITAASEWFGPQSSPPASHAPKPTTESSGPLEPSRPIRTMPSNHKDRSADRRVVPGRSPTSRATLDASDRGRGRRSPGDRKKEHGPAGHRPMTKTVEERDHVVVRFAGDSGDGMQLTGDRFTNATAILGNDLATLPDFPAEIRAPAGTVHGVSAFQIQFASTDITTPGDHADVLVAMNPAALKADLDKVARGGTIIINEDAFMQRNLDKAGYASDPTTDGSLDGYQLYRVPMTSITARAVESLGVGKKEAERSKNMFALGLVSWMYGRPVDVTLRWLESKFGGKPEIYEANVASFNAGYNFGETTELFSHQIHVAAAPVIQGIYRNVAGSQALAWGLIAASIRSGVPLFYASYPITPASDLLHELSKHKNYGVVTFHAVDELAAANMALGAAFTGHLGVTGTSGPGIDLKAETIGLAVITELLMILVDVMRAGPSTGMPTKNEQGDLLHAMFGRHGESPIPIVAPSSPADCFSVAMEAAHIAPLEVDDPTGDAELLVLGWGSTAGTIRAAVQRVRGSGERVATAHLRWLNPMPTNTGEVVTKYRRVLIPELNSGQLTMLIRAAFLADAKTFSKVQGLPIWADELEDAIVRMLHG